MQLDSFLAAKPHLSPRVAGRAQQALVVLGLELENAAAGAMAVAPISADLGVGVVVDVDGQGVLVSSTRLDDWGVGLPDVIQSAFELTLGTEVSEVFQLADGTYIVRDERFTATALLNPDLLAGFPVAGAAVVLVPDTGTLLLTGADDLAGLDAIARAAAQIIDGGAKLVSASPVVYRDGSWHEFAWPPEVSSSSTQLAALWATTLYGWQKPLLERRLANDRADVFVASASMARRSEDSPVFTHATLTEGVATALPVVGVVVLVPDNGAPTPIDWAVFVEAFGTKLVPMGVLPERFMAQGFPDAAAIGQMLAASAG